MEDFQESPNGIWYPTQIHRSIYLTSSLDHLLWTGTTYFFLEFNQDLSANLSSAPHEWK